MGKAPEKAFRLEVVLISKKESPRCGQGSEDFRLVLVVMLPGRHLDGDLVGQAV